jgi:hypothetical protein
MEAIENCIIPGIVLYLIYFKVYVYEYFLGKTVFRIRDPVPLGPLDPEWVKNQDQDPGITPRA